VSSYQLSVSSGQFSVISGNAEFGGEVGGNQTVEPQMNADARKWQRASEILALAEKRMGGKCAESRGIAESLCDDCGCGFGIGCTEAELLALGIRHVRRRSEIGKGRKARGAN
jgi:hypothetical protein